MWKSHSIESVLIDWSYSTNGRWLGVVYEVKGNGKENGECYETFWKEEVKLSIKATEVEREDISSLSQNREEYQNYTLQLSSSRLSVKFLFKGFVSQKEESIV